MQPIAARQEPLAGKTPEYGNAFERLLACFLDWFVLYTVTAIRNPLIALVVAWLYFAALESSAWQGTLGKRLFNLKVVGPESGRISFLRASGRFFAKFLSVLPLFAGLIVSFFNSRKQTWHDSLAGTMVIKEEK